MLILDTPSVSITYDPEARRLLLNWTGYISSAAFREAIDQAITYASENNVLAVLGNIKKQEVIRSEDVEFAVNSIDRLKEAGVQVLVLVVPENIFARMSLKKFSEKADNYFVKYFEDQEKAEAWINENINVFS